MTSSPYDTPTQAPVQKSRPWLLVAFILLLFAFLVSLGGGTWLYIRAIQAQHAARLDAEIARDMAEHALQQERKARQQAEQQQSP